MKARMHVADPDAVLVTAEFTMSMANWRTIQEHLKDAPAWGVVGDFTSAIRSMTGQVNQEIPPAPAGDE